MEQSTTRTEPKTVTIKPEFAEELEELAKNKNMTLEEYINERCHDATTFNLNSQPEASIEVKLNPEQFTLLRKWLENNELITVYTHQNDGAMILNETQIWRNNHPKSKELIGGEVLQLKIEVFSGFIDFARQYLGFFGDYTQTVEGLVMESFYAWCRKTHGDLEKFTADKKHLLDPEAFWNRFPCQVHGEDEEESKDC